MNQVFSGEVAGRTVASTYFRPRQLRRELNRLASTDLNSIHAANLDDGRKVDSPITDPVYNGSVNLSRQLANDKTGNLVALGAEVSRTKQTKAMIIGKTSVGFLVEDYRSLGQKVMGSRHSSLRILNIETNVGSIEHEPGMNNDRLHRLVATAAFTLNHLVDRTDSTGDVYIPFYHMPESGLDLNDILVLKLAGHTAAEQPNRQAMIMRDIQSNQIGHRLAGVGFTYIGGRACLAFRQDYLKSAIEKILNTTSSYTCES